MTHYATKISEKLSRVTKPAVDAADMSRFYSDAHIVNKPFFFRGTSSKGILLIHGWSSTPYELRALGEHLNREGYTVYAPILSGHGTAPEDLEGVTWQHWLEDVEEAYTDMQACCETVSVAGMSFGGTLSLHLAQKYSDVAGLILLGTPYKLRYETIGEKIAHITKRFVKYKRKFYPRLFGANAPGMTRLISYQRYPVESALQAFSGIQASLEGLHRVTQPCMIIQSRTDHLITPDSADRIHRNIGSQNKELRVLENAYHNFIGDQEHAYLFEDITTFLQKA